MLCWFFDGRGKPIEGWNQKGSFSHRESTSYIGTFVCAWMWVCVQVWFLACQGNIEIIRNYNIIIHCKLCGSPASSCWDMSGPVLSGPVFYLLFCVHLLYTDAFNVTMSMDVMK